MMRWAAGGILDDRYKRRSGVGFGEWVDATGTPTACLDGQLHSDQQVRKDEVDAEDLVAEAPVPEGPEQVAE